ncbi:MAG: hypothetical protein KKB51_09360 [Candidatus Riflebacteria bacterium]|nr:hypothetical protein [Candidatus Riflebacteria bacterium]
MMKFLDADLQIWLLIGIFSAWLPPARLQVYFITLIGMAFLGYFDLFSLQILCSTAMLAYWICNYRQPHGKQVAITLSLFAVIFSYFKIQQGSEIEKIVIPLGLSYYLFRQTHYILEMYKGTLRPHNFIEYFSYLFLLPTIVVGPIHRFPAFLSDLRRRRWDWARFSLGLERAFHGYAKLIIIANFALGYFLRDYFVQTADIAGFSKAAFLNSAYMWIDLYIRFSAYSDIAIGVSAMMGFTIIENFNNPFMSENISEFWKRWHISLTSWCSDYFYKPVAAITRRPFVATSGTMLIIGLWHGFSLHYILWGMYHALGIALQQRWSSFRQKLASWDNHFLTKIESGANIVLTFCFVAACFPVTTWLQQNIEELLKGAYHVFFSA